MQLKLHQDKSLSDYTTLHIGGAADFLVEVKNERELLEALQFAKEKTTTQPLVLGGGSNVLCSDDGYRGLVIVNKIRGYEVVSETKTETVVSVGAGETLDDIIVKTVSDNLWGLENLSAIPGSAGATPIQNVGAYGVEIASLIESVTAININTSETKQFANSDCTFGYRDSFFKTQVGKDWCVTTVFYRLSKLPKPILVYQDLGSLKGEGNVTQEQIREQVIKVRANKFPSWQEVGTAGSFFKNPIISKSQFVELQAQYPELTSFPVSEEKVKVSLGWILDKVCDLRGYQKGNVRLYEKQALVLVTENDATATEVEDFVSYIEDLVKEKTDITVEREVLSV